VVEVAEILGIPTGTAKSRLFKARADLEKALREEEQP
jgi:DNA-directed RNA polymerase specialized sigma24 family protein